MSQLVRTAQRVVNATPETVFELLATPARHADIDGSGGVQGAKQDAPQRLRLGAEFSMRMRVGLPYSTTNRVVEFEEGRRIAWQTAARVKDRIVFGGQVWRYELTDLGDGRTLVRESYDLTDALASSVVAATAGAKTEQVMKTTLERIAMLVDGHNQPGTGDPVI